MRRAVWEVCADFPNEYWCALDEKREYPEAFVQTRAESGYLGYGGMGLGLCAARAILEEVYKSRLPDHVDIQARHIRYAVGERETSAGDNAR